MTDKELIDSEALDDKATKWVNEVVPEMYKALEKAGIHYDEEMLCHSLADGFKIGYATCWREVKGTDGSPN